MFREWRQLATGGALGKLTGLVREVLFASFLGTSTWADAYRTALATTVSVSHLFTSEALTTAFVPQFGRYLAQQPPKAWTLLKAMLILLVPGAIIVATALFLSARWIIDTLYPGFDAEQVGQSVEMLRIMAVGIVPYVLSAMWISVAMGRGSFVLAAARPAVQNLGVIAAIIIAWWLGNPRLIACGFTGTYLLFMLVTWWYLRSRGLFDEGWLSHFLHVRSVLRRFCKSLGPLLPFAAAIQLMVLVEKAVATLVGSGAVAAVDYARFITELASLLVVVPLGLVSLASMAHLTAEEARHRSDAMCAVAALLLVPTSAFLLVAAEDLVRVIYEHGAFQEDAVVVTTRALRGMALSLWCTGLAYILLRVFNAQLRNREVLLIGLLGVVVNVTANIVLYRPLGVASMGVAFTLYGLVTLFAFAHCIGGLPKTRTITMTCLSLAVVYVGLGWLIDRQLEWYPVARLLVHVAFGLAYWIGLLAAIPITRDVLREIVRRVRS
ncbi:MAG: hypothetical protein IH830_13460 [Planctomycetes bacterium]|nr:hypothetical protein [Planctomycetota bacterium]